MTSFRSTALVPEGHAGPCLHFLRDRPRVLLREEDAPTVRRGHAPLMRPVRPPRARGGKELRPVAAGTLLPIPPHYNLPNPLNRVGRAVLSPFRISLCPSVPKRAPLRYPAKEIFLVC
jgi:hypothetical protein